MVSIIFINSGRLSLLPDLPSSQNSPILERIDEELLTQVKEKSAYIFETLKNAEGIKSVSGMGLMIGIETEADASVVIAKCMERGLLPIKAKTKIRLLPALNIPMDDLKKAIEIIKDCAKGE